LKSSLNNLEPQVFEKLLDIEVNLIPILAEVGIVLTREDIKNEILKDPSQLVVISFKDTEISALLRYSRCEDHLFIKSIALNPKFGALAFRRLIKDVLPAFQDETVESIESVVQISNQRSISMHEKLGFEVMKQSSKAIRYRIPRLLLINKITKKSK
jgi:hypothetical protein